MQDVHEIRVTNDFYAVRLIRGGRLSPVATELDLVSKAREQAERLGASQSPPLTILSFVTCRGFLAPDGVEMSPSSQP